MLRVKGFESASDPKYDRYQKGLASMVYKLFDKKSSGGAIKLYMQIIRQFKRRKVYSSFRDNIWGVDLADMQSLNK